MKNHKLFEPKSFEEGKNCVVGDCNGYTMQERWDQETPLFAKEISKYIPEGGTAVDYGCGVGRLAKIILDLRNDETFIIGVDESEEMRNESERYINNTGTFDSCAPEQLTNEINDMEKKADLIYLVYVLQHVPAIYIREILSRISFNLKDDGKFIYCSSDFRMAINFDEPGFFDDRFLGVNLQAEVERFFVKEKPLFEADVLNNNPLLNKMITGKDGGLAHPAFVYGKK